MSSRKGNDGTSQNGVSFAAGNPSVVNAKNCNYSQTVNNSLLVTGTAYNGHAVEVWADNAVWDTVSGTFLFPGRDYNPADIQRK